MEERSLEAQLRDEYTPRVQDMTLEELPEFINSIMDREHDYGSICVAIGLCAAATAWACNKHDKGGITGFQSGAVFWEFVRAWGTPQIGEAGARLLNFDELLFPQYKSKFTTVPDSIAKELQHMAVRLLEETPDANTQVTEHWKKIAAGELPFGLTVVK